MAATTERTAVIRCRDGEHTLQLKDREAVAQRLLTSSRKHSFDPETDVDWDAPLDPARLYTPPHMISIYETPLWDGLSDDQRVELSKREMASLMSLGIYAEVLLMQGLAGYTYRQPVDSANVAYALTEIADECRHSIMFGRLINKVGLRAVRLPAHLYHAGKFTPSVHIPLQLFALVLIVEEILDTWQRALFPDESIQAVVREVTRIHVIEEARHITYAREHLRHLAAAMSPTRRRAHALLLAPFAAQVTRALIHPSCYAAVGLDPRLAKKAAARSPHRAETVAWMFQRTLGFFDQIGLLDGPAHLAWQRTGLLTKKETTR